MTRTLEVNARRVKCFPVTAGAEEELRVWAGTLYHLQYEFDTNGDTWFIFDRDEDATMFIIKFGHLLP